MHEIFQKIKSKALGILPTDINVNILGISHNSQETLIEDIMSRIYITYRHNFPLIQDSNYDSDIGWGCMLRCGQSIVAETLSRHLLGRDWRRREENISSDDIYIFIVSLFLDNPNAYFSIHSFASTGKKNFDIEIGKWFGPLSIGQTIHQLISNWDKDFNLKCYLSQDSAIYKDEVEELIGSSWNCSLLLLLPVRLGTDVLNPVYYSGIINCLKLKQSVGIAGGRPNSAHFFIGVENEEMDKEGELGNMSDCKPCDHLLYLDPHISKPSLPVKNVYLASEFSSYHSNSAKRISIDKLDPSLLVGFYCKDENDYLEILDFVLQKQGQYPIFSAIEKKPDYSFWDSIETFE